MPTVIDALVATLGLDASGFLKGEAQTKEGLRNLSAASDKTGGDMELVAKKITAGIQRVRNEIIGLFALVTAGRGIKALTEDITEGDAATGRLASSLGMTTESLAAWQGAAERTGGSAAGITGSIQSMSAALEQFRVTGQMDEGMINWFNRLGISLRDADTGKFKTVTQLYLDIAGKMRGMDPREANLIGNAFHMDQGTINTLRQGVAEVDRLRANAMKLGVPSDADAKRAQTLLNDVSDLQQAFTGLARTILNEVSPALDAMMKQLVAWIEANGPRIRAEITDRIEAFVRWLQGVDWTAILAAIGQVINGFGRAVDAVAGMTPALQHVLEFVAGAWLLGMLGPIAKVAAALAGVGGGLAGAGAAAGGGTILGGAAAVGGGVTIGTNAAYWIERWLRGKEVADEHARHSWFAQTFGFGAATGGGAGADGSRSEQDGFIDRFVQKLATLRALSLINPDGTVSGSYGLGDYGGVATPGEMARVRGLRAGAGQADLGNAEMQAREKQAFDFFRGQGWTAEQTAGIVANIRKESGFREGAIGDHGAAFGLGQWHPDRQAALKAAGYDLTNASYRRQLEAVQYEMTRGREAAAGVQLRRAQTAAEAGAAVSRYYERPKDVEGEAADRGGIAERVLRQQTPSPSDVVPGPGAPTGAPFIVGSAAQRWGRLASNTTHNSSETNINGPITIHTRATDAQGIAVGLRDKLASLNLASQMNRGLT